MPNPSDPSDYRRWTVRVAQLLLLSLLTAELAFSIRWQSQTWDEALHILAGYRYWQAADFGINPEHPPLAKLAATIPLLVFRPKMSVVPSGTSKQVCFVAARNFLYAQDADVLLFRCRMAASIFTLLLALLLFEGAREMFGTGVAFLALIVLVFEPNILAHGALVTTDVGLACCLFAAVYAFYRYVKKQTMWMLLECGLATGLTLVVKHSGILIFPILGFLAAAECFVDRPPESKDLSRSNRAGLAQRALHWAGRLAIIAVIAITVLWASYGFRFSARPDGQALAPSLADLVSGSAGTGIKNPLEARLILALAHTKVLPESYLYGLADVLIVSAGPRSAFLFGKLHPRGFWYYFPAVFLIKSTLGFLLLLLCTLAAMLVRVGGSRREILFLTLPAVVYFAVSLTSGLNVGVRHILPVYPFLIALAAAGAWELGRGHRAWRYAVGALLAVHVISSVRTYPNYFAYSNEIWGGPSKTYRVLTDSNVDSGQGLRAALDYLKRHGTTDCWMAYFGSADPGYYHLPCKFLPNSFAGWWGQTEIVPQTYTGTVLISATELSGAYWGPAELNPYEQFQRMRPVDIIGDSILVYEGRFDFTRASVWSHVDRAWDVYDPKQLNAAVAEARAAVALGPRTVVAHYALAFMLAQSGHKDEARSEYEAALTLAKTNHPDFQWYWIPLLKKSMDALQGQH